MNREPSLDDGALDTRLRQVAVPRDLAARLREIPLRPEPAAEPEAADDAWTELAAELRSVPLPAELAARLAKIPAGISAPLADAELDARLRDVPVGSALACRLRLTPVVERRRREAWKSAALAASLLLAATVSYGLGVASFLAERAWFRPPQHAGGPILELAADLGSAPAFDAPSTDEGLVAISLAADSLAAVELPPLDVVEAEPPLRPREDSFWRELLTRDGRDRFFRDLNEPRWSAVFTADGRTDDLPELARLPAFGPRGIEPPQAPGFDWRFYVRYRVHPWVRTKDYPRSVAPLGADPSGYALARRHVQEGERPPAELLRTDEFLAAFHYGFAPARTAAVELRTAIGPSPFRQGRIPQARLLHVAALAREAERTDLGPSHLVVAVDVSASMQWGGRLELAQQGLRDLAARLGPQDRLSLVAFASAAEIVLDRAGREEAAVIAEAIDSLRPDGATSLGVGLQRAFSQAGEATLAGPERRRVVLLSDGQVALPEEVMLRLEETLGTTGIPLDVVDLGQTGRPDPTLARVASAARGEVVRACRSEEVAWRLRESLWGQSQVAAQGVRMSVQFDPRAVVAFRLLGHETSLAQGAGPGPTQIDIRFGEAASALYEIQLAANDEETLGSVELEWLPRDGGETRRSRRLLTRTQVANSFQEAAESLQLATLVAETAEVLRGSPFAGSSNLDSVQALSERVSPGLARTAAWREFQRFVELASRAKARP